MKARSHCIEGGMALLEAAIVSVLLMTLVIGGIAARQIITRVDEVRSIANRPLLQMSVKPLEIRFTPTGEPEVRVHIDRLSVGIREAAEAAEIQLRQALSNNGTPEEPFFIEAKFAVVHVDPSTGRPTGQIDRPALSS